MHSDAAEQIDVDLGALVQRGGSWQATVPARAFARFGAALDEAGSESKSADSVAVALSCRRDEAGRAHVFGTCRLRASVVCSGCAEAVAVRTETAIDFRIAASDAEAERLADVDAVVLDEDRATLAALVEDDLLLALPERGCTDSALCPRALALAEAQVEDAAQAAQKEGPFAALAALKRPGMDKASKKEAMPWRYRSTR